MYTFSRNHTLGHKNATNQHIELIVLHYEMHYSAFQIRPPQGTKEDQSVSVTSHELSKIQHFER